MAVTLLEGNWDVGKGGGGGGEGGGERGIECAVGHYTFTRVLLSCPQKIVILRVF